MSPNPGWRPKRRTLTRTNRIVWEPDFLRLWGGHSASLFGSEITRLALPLVAINTLGASAQQMGVLAAAGTLPFLLLSLPVGVWADRRRRRPILIATDLLRAGVLLTVPFAIWFDIVNFVHLALAAFTVGALTTTFEVAHYAYVPSLVGRERVVDANSKLQMSYSVADAGGPGVGGLLIQFASAPVALVIDACSFLLDAMLLSRIRKPEPPLGEEDRGNVVTAIRDGLRALLGHPLLKPIVVGSMSHSFFESAIGAIFVLYVTRDLGVQPAKLGMIFAAGGVGALLGALLSKRLAERYGAGPTFIRGWVLGLAAPVLIPLASGPMAAPFLAVIMLVAGVGATVANIQQWSLRQMVTPDALQGRVTASHRFLVYGAMPVGAIVGGLVGGALGLRPAIAIFALAGLTSPLWAVFSPLRRLHRFPVRP